MERELTAKQLAFVEEYLACWNATEAARRAGYSGTDGTLAVTGWGNLRNPKIAVLVRERIAERAMTADEVLARLAEQARGDLSDFVKIGPRGSVQIDLAKAERLGKMHLVKRFTKRKGQVQIEMYDAQAALVHLGKNLGLFTERIEMSGNLSTRMDLSQLTDDDLTQLEGLLDRAADTAGRGGREGPTEPA